MNEKNRKHTNNTSKENIYQNWLLDLKARIRHAQLQAMVKVNEELLKLYWEIGNSIIEKQKELGWGAKIIDKLSTDLKNLIPENHGFSVRNLKYMRQFASEYPDFPFVQVPLAQNKSVQVPLTQISWYHHITLLTKIKDISIRAFYIHATIENGWSRNTMLHQIESQLHLRKGKAINNFNLTLPQPESELAKDIFKDPYNFDFITLNEKINELEIENQLIQKISKFLLELGKGFAYIGRQYHIKVANEDYYIDLLFYHTQLRCYIVIEVKTGTFKPEYIGKLNFYLTAVDEQIASKHDNPSLGLLLCKEKNNIVVEYALRGNTKPLSVAEYKVSTSLPRNIKSKLPSIKEIEKKLKE